MLSLSILDKEYLQKVAHALSTDLRLNILELIEKQTLSCTEIAKSLGYPLPTIISNIDILQSAGLVSTTLIPARNGHTKLCTPVYYDIFIRLGKNLMPVDDSSEYRAEIPVGNYLNFDVAPTCGFVVDENNYFLSDDPNCLLDPRRINASLLWFKKGYVEYRIPINIPPKSEIKSITFELEICSEAPGYNNSHKSDITLWINDFEIGTYLSPGDFGGVKGKYNPDFWGLEHTQFGKLTKWKISQNGCFINDLLVSETPVSHLDILHETNYVTMRLGIKPDAKNIGGINIFGRGFGNYSQDIKMIVEYFEA